MEKMYFEKYKFKNHSGKKIDDIAGYIKEYTNDSNEIIKYQIYVGCDSQVSNSNTIYSTVIGIHRIVGGVGRGVHIIHTREKTLKLNESRGAIFKRLWGEVERIVEVVTFLQDNGIDNIETHVDANSNKQYVSNAIYDSAMGWLKSMGFEVNAKPDAWAATYAANKYCR